MAVSFAQSVVGVRTCASSGAMTQQSVTTASGDVLLIFEVIGRTDPWQPAWKVDGGSDLTPLTTYNEAGECIVNIYVMSGLSATSHTIDCTNPSSGGAAGRQMLYGITVATGADPSAIDSGDVHADISSNTAATKTWSTGPVAANGAAVGLLASRAGAAVSSVDHTNLGTTSTGGSAVSYSSAALQAYTPASAVTDETLSVTFGATGSGAYIGIILAPGSSGTSATVEVPLGAASADVAAPLVSADVSVTIALGTSAAGGLPPTVTAETAVIGGGLAAAAAGGIPPTVTGGSGTVNATVAVPLAGASAAARPPAVSASVVLAVPCGAATATARPPAVSAASTVTTPLAAAATAGRAPSASASAVVTTPLAAAATAGRAPSASASAVVTVVTVPLAVVGTIQPTVHAEVTIQVPYGCAAAAGIPPTRGVTLRPADARRTRVLYPEQRTRVLYPEDRTLTLEAP